MKRHSRIARFKKLLRLKFATFAPILGATLLCGAQDLDPKIASAWPTPEGYGPSVNVTISGNSAYLRTAEGRDASSGTESYLVHEIDITNPTNPVYLGEVEEQIGMFDGVIVSGSLGYRTYQVPRTPGNPTPPVGVFEVLDISDPELLVAVGSMELQGYFGPPSFVNGYVYLRETREHADGRHSPNRLLIVDVSDPENPFIANAIEDVFLFLQEGVVDGNLFYAAMSDGGFQILDVTDTVNPVELGRYWLSDLIYINDVAVSGDYAVVRASAVGTTILDISNPREPMRIGRYHRGQLNNAAGGGDVALKGRYAFLPGIGIVDILNPATPQRLSSYSLGANPFSSGTAVSMPVAAIAVAGVNGSALKILDVSDSRNPLPLSEVDISTREVRSVLLEAGLVYVSGYSGDAGILEIFDVTGPETPVKLSEQKVGGQISGMVKRGEHVFVVGELEEVTPNAPNPHGFLSIWDVSNPQDPRTVGTVTTPEIAICAEVVGDYAYVSDYADLFLVDVSDPTAPLLLGSIRSPSPHNVTASGDSLYISVPPAGSNPGGVEILDVSIPGSPILVGTIDVNSPGRVTTSGSIAYVCGDGGLHVYDVSNPEASVRLGGNSSFASYEVIVSDGTLFAASSDLIILDEYQMLRIGPAFVRPEDQKIRLPIKGVNVKRALIQRSTDMVTWEDWKTMDLEDNTCEAVDLITGEPQYFYRAVEVKAGINE